ncbi:HEPN domain-containing protein [Vallitalea okinawensis]|uniref:HEPN domain-containing protein n=1 Tax=Vallitalea okinawensis TaxID=2078660 RepID=UPI000CFC8F8C|nr:HEPN domain-containing protein [Vallitalea okinawensis]
MAIIGKIARDVDVNETYYRLAQDDEKAAEMLKFNRMYRQATYFYIQAMEKYIRAKIFTIVNPNIEYFRDKNRDHSLDKAIDFLLEIITTNENVRLQIRNQINTFVLGNVRYNQLHNNLRYPFYSKRYDNYSVLDIEEIDCLTIENNLQALKKYLRELGRM